MKILILVCALMALTRADDDAVVAATDHPEVMAIEHPEAEATEHPELEATEHPEEATEAPVPEPVWTNFNGRSFLYVPKLQTWTDAEKHCQEMRANLASVHSEFENQFLQELVNVTDNHNPEVFIGGSDAQQNNAWLWSDGSGFSYTNWCAGKPDDQCAVHGCLHMNHGTGFCWDDTDCAATRSSLCAINM